MTTHILPQQLAKPAGSAARGQREAVGRARPGQIEGTLLPVLRHIPLREAARAVPARGAGPGPAPARCAASAPPPAVDSQPLAVVGAAGR